MRNTAANLPFNATFINKSFINKPKVNVQLRWISLFSKSSWVKTTASGLSYELRLGGEKKLMETGMLLIKWT